jgi:hypothetical protein
LIDRHFCAQPDVRCPWIRLLVKSLSQSNFNFSTDLDQAHEGRDELRRLHVPAHRQVRARDFTKLPQLRGRQIARKQGIKCCSHRMLWFCCHAEAKFPDAHFCKRISATDSE